MYLPKDLLKKRGHIAKSSLFVELILPAYIYRDQALCLDTHRVSLKIHLSQKANSKAEEENRLLMLSLQQSCSECPKMFNPWIKALMATSLFKTFRETNV